MSGETEKIKEAEAQLERMKEVRKSIRRLKNRVLIFAIATAAPFLLCLLYLLSQLVLLDLHIATFGAAVGGMLSIWLVFSSAHAWLKSNSDSDGLRDCLIGEMRKSLSIIPNPYTHNEATCYLAFKLLGPGADDESVQCELEKTYGQVWKVLEAYSVANETKKV